MNFGFIKRFYLEKSYAYSLAEMLIVLFIISIVLLSLPKATKKFFEVKEVKTYHGRYECYWSRNNDGTPQLKYFYTKDRVGLDPLEDEGNIDGDSCEFTPPLTYPYIMIHAVGGGGAGGNIETSVENPVIASSYVDYLPSNRDAWPSWFSLFRNTNPNGFNLNSKDVYSTIFTTRQMHLKYRKSGNAGAMSSMFFPFLPSGKTFRLYPGRGGELAGENENGNNGENSVVQVMNFGESCDKTQLDSACNIMVARGGTGAFVIDNSGRVIDMESTVQLAGGKKSDFKISNYKDVIEKESGFYNIIDSIERFETKGSKISANAGNGGNGANHYVKDSTAGFYFHEFDNFQGSAGREVGVKWEPISGYINVSSYLGNSGCQSYSTNLSSRIGLQGGFWIQRSSVGDISTQCIADMNTTGSKPNYYYCTVGYMKRLIIGEVRSNNDSDAIFNCSNQCESNDKGPCACYTYKYANNKYSLIGSPYYNSNSISNLYRNPTFEIVTPSTGDPYILFTVEQHIPDNAAHIFCPSADGFAYNAKSGSGTTPCASGGEYDASKGICKAKRGGDGAIVILW